MRPVIALLTDFGTRDHYAGTMKGVVLGICPDATLVDITHDIPPHDVLGGRAGARGGVPVFPAGHHLPRRRRSRRRLGAPRHRRRGRRLPVRRARQRRADRGASTSTPPKRVVELTERRYARPTVSRTFEGRDRFAPAAAWLAKGIDLDGARPPGRRDVSGSTFRSRAVDADAIDGEVLRVDRFGNLITNIDRADVRAVRRRRRARRSASAIARSSRVVSTYAEARAGRVCALSAAPTTSRSPSTAAAPPRAARRSARGAPCVHDRRAVGA